MTPVLDAAGHLSPASSSLENRRREDVREIANLPATRLSATQLARPEIRPRSDVRGDRNAVHCLLNARINVPVARPRLHQARRAGLMQPLGLISAPSESSNHHLKEREA